MIYLSGERREYYNKFGALNLGNGRKEHAAQMGVGGSTRASGEGEGSRDSASSQVEFFSDSKRSLSKGPMRSYRKIVNSSTWI